MSDPYTSLPNTCEAIMVYTMGGQVQENVYFFQGATSWSMSLLSTFATDLFNTENISLKSLRNQFCQLIHITTIDRSTQFGPRADSGFSVFGTDTSAPMPNNATVALSWRTAKRGRRFRGRTYHIGLSEGMLDNTAQSISASAGVLLVTGYQHLISNTFTNSAKLVVAHQVEARHHIAAGTVEPVLNVTTTDLFVDSQRRRLPGHNRHR